MLYLHLEGYFSYPVHLWNPWNIYKKKKNVFIVATETTVLFLGEAISIFTPTRSDEKGQEDQ